MTDILSIKDIEDLDREDARTWLERIVEENEYIVKQIVARKAVISMSLKGASDEVVDAYAAQEKGFFIELEWVRRQIASAQTLLETL